MSQICDTCPQNVSQSCDTRPVCCIDTSSSWQQVHKTHIAHALGGGVAKLKNIGI